MKAIVASKTALKSIPLEKKRRIRGLLIFVYSTHSYGFFCSHFDYTAFALAHFYLMSFYTYDFNFSGKSY